MALSFDRCADFRLRARSAQCRWVIQDFARLASAGVEGDPTGGALGRAVASANEVVDVLSSQYQLPDSTGLVQKTAYNAAWAGGFYRVEFLEDYGAQGGSKAPVAIRRIALSEVYRQYGEDAAIGRAPAAAGGGAPGAGAGGAGAYANHPGAGASYANEPLAGGTAYANAPQSPYGQRIPAPSRAAAAPASGAAPYANNPLAGGSAYANVPGAGQYANVPGAQNAARVDPRSQYGTVIPASGTPQYANVPSLDGASRLASQNLGVRVV